MPRPRKLDETKRAQLCAMVAAGVHVHTAARLMGCNRNTVHNEARRNRQFARALKRAKSQAQIHPLRTMQQAATTNWRAAAWWLERLAPETFAQPVAAVLGKREANKFVADLIRIIDETVNSPVERARMTELLSAAMPSAMRRAWNYRQSRRKLEQALDYFADKDRSEAGGDPVDALLAPDPETERNVERVLASLGEHEKGVRNQFDESKGEAV